MENASKALLMAAGVLLGIMILSLGVYIFTNFGGTSSQIHDNIQSTQIEQFNSQFTQYIGKENVTIYDVISMASLATENNRVYEFPKRGSYATGIDNYITVLLDGVSIEFGYGSTNQDMEEEYYGLLADEMDDITSASSDLPKYNVQITISNTTQRVCLVSCSKKT